jgi:hypothetical protein
LLIKYYKQKKTGLLVKNITFDCKNNYYELGANTKGFSGSKKCYLFPKRCHVTHAKPGIEKSN